MLNATPIIAIASGKGGAGKTSFTLNLAYTLSQMGKRVCVFDADIGLANVDVQLGVHVDADLGDVLSGKCEMADIVTQSDKGFSIIPGRSGSSRAPFMTALERREILRGIRDIAGQFDIIFLDIAAGIDQDVLNFTKFADRTLLVVTPDPSSITDAYAVIKLMKNLHEKETCEVIINQATSQTEGKNTYAKIQTACQKFLNVDVPLIGVLPYDKNYSSAVKMQKIAAIAYPDTEAVHAVQGIARQL